jgi:putative ABC transport system permease protein
MLTHYLRIALRHLRRNKLYSFVSIGCLSIGICVCLTIMLYVLHEHSFESWHPDARRIFSTSAMLKFGEGSFNVELMSYGTGPRVKAADPLVESYTRVNPAFAPVDLQDPSKPGIDFTERDNFVYADSNFYFFFRLRLDRGDPHQVLTRPYSMVLTERAAKKYFGSTDPVGRTLQVDGQYTFEITGVAANPPSNTDLQYDFIASISSMATMKDRKNYLNSPDVQAGAFRTWFLLKNAGAARQVERMMDKLAVLPDNTEKNKDAFFLTSIRDYHLDANFGDTSNQRYLSIFPLVAGLILLLALVNFMSLATARTAAQGREVGVRKVLGARRGLIAGQFYTESAVFALLSFLLGIALFVACRPYFLRLLQLQIDVSFLLTPGVLTGGLGLLLLVILLAGSYPSLVLSAYRPVAVLYGKLSRHRGAERVRKGFIVFQFSISMLLVISSLIIEKELYFLRHTETGVDRDNVMMIPFGTHLGHYAAFKHDVEDIPGILGAATSHYPLYRGTDGWAVTKPGSDKQVELNGLSVDDQFISMLGLKWDRKPVDGPELYDGKHLLLNEAAISKLGFAGDPVGQRVMLGNETLTVAGVLRNFNYDGLRNSIGPLFVSVSKDTARGWGNGVNGCLLAKVGSHRNVPTVVETIRKIYRRYDRQTAFEYSFADDAFDNQFKAEDRLAGLFGIFTGITIVIACLGLFALATFAAQQRLKEIGIRKVLGASVASIGSLLSRDFLRPVLLSVVIASPLAWWVMHRWLQDFAYRTSVSWWVFPLAGGGLLLIAQLTVLWQTIRAAQANPTVNLRSE